MKNFKKINENIDSYFGSLNDLKNNIFKFELILKNGPLSLRKKCSEKIYFLKKEIEIKNKIIEYHKKFSNFITINNII